MKKSYGYYEKFGVISEEKFNDFSEIEQWAADKFGCYDTDYLFALDEDEVEETEKPVSEEKEKKLFKK